MVTRKVETKAKTHKLAHYETDKQIKVRVTQNATTFSAPGWSHKSVSWGSKTEKDKKSVGSRNQFSTSSTRQEDPASLQQTDLRLHRSNNSGGGWRTLLSCCCHHHTNTSRSDRRQKRGEIFWLSHLKRHELHTGEKLNYCYQGIT